jgi:hypothetical protein
LLWTASAKVVSSTAKEFEDNVAAAINYSPTEYSSHYNPAK